jgi:hypothetical protein
MNAKVPDGQKVTDAATGTKVAPRVGDYVSKYMVMDFISDTACRSNASLYMTSRYPYCQVDSQGRMQAADCTAAAQRIADLKARVATKSRDEHEVQIIPQPVNARRHAKKYRHNAAARYNGM